jgi:hypothetical protein
MSNEINEMNYAVLEKAAKDVAIEAGVADWETPQYLYSTINKVVIKVDDKVITIKIEEEV